MKRKSLAALLMIVAVLTAMLFTGCGKKATPTLEDYCKDNPEVQENIDSAMADSNVAVEIKGNEIIYNFDLSKADGYTEELAKSDEIKTALEGALASAGSTFGNISKSIEESTEISGISTTVNYLWGDELIVTKSFTSADAEASAESESD